MRSLHSNRSGHSEGEGDRTGADKARGAQGECVALFNLSTILRLEQVSTRKSEAILAWGERNGLDGTSSWRSNNYNWPIATANVRAEADAEGACVGFGVQRNYVRGHLLR
ncbi:hypothetical protein LOD99_6873 [Oopsacas minuta]|uniref:Uncharacterized protein n=1 Tax=Oopsacas minuta TaxID=111878 RepID=A0AAV7JJA9_9METZ|nr:hypothetical protein LOD99_6873 [Oopsacas minuta]